MRDYCLFELVYKLLKNLVETSNNFQLMLILLYSLDHALGIMSEL